MKASSKRILLALAVLALCVYQLTTRGRDQNSVPQAVLTSELSQAKKNRESLVVEPKMDFCSAPEQAPCNCPKNKSTKTQRRLGKTRQKARSLRARLSDREIKKRVAAERTNRALAIMLEYSELDLQDSKTLERYFQQFYLNAYDIGKQRISPDDTINEIFRKHEVGIKSALDDYSKRWTGAVHNEHVKFWDRLKLSNKEWHSLYRPLSDTMLAVQAFKYRVDSRYDLSDRKSYISHRNELNEGIVEIYRTHLREVLTDENYNKLLEELEFGYIQFRGSDEFG